LVIAIRVDPAAQRNGLPNVAGSKFTAGVRAIQGNILN
jgi:hypothetical protein